jgi:hypothetical protein
MNVPRASAPDRPDAAPVHEPARDDGEAWVRHIRRGEFDAAWRLSDRELSRPRPADAFTRPRHLQRIWDGRPVDGRRVLVRCYHGLGDTIQFARFLPTLAARAASVVVWAQPALLPLLETIDAPLELLPLHDGVPDVTFDVDVEIMELAWLLRMTPQTLPRRTPYLRVEADRPRGGRPFTVGVVWRGGGWNPARATTAAALAPLADVPGVRLLAFDPAPTAEDLTDWPGEWAPASTVCDLARAIAATDVLISVDTLAAHLAGALGVPVWTLLNHDPDWRWMLDRDDSPWYPTMRLFRQPAPAAWPAVMGRVRAALWTAATWPALAAHA